MSGQEKTTARPSIDLQGQDKNRAFRARLTQILVFVNGLILSVTAFMTLNIFMTQMRDDAVQTATDTTVAATADMLRYITRDMRVLGHLHQANAGDGVISDTGMAELLTDIEVYDRIMLFEHQGGDRWSARDIYQNSERLDRASEEWRLSGEAYAPILLPMVSSERPIAFRPFTENTQHGFIALKNMATPEGARTVHAFFVNGEAYYTNHGILGKEDLPQMSLTVEPLRIPIYQRGDDLLPGMGLASQNLASVSETFEVAGLEMTLDMNIREDFRILFLSKIPYLIMLFGVTLTMIGTLYVRNNFRQSQKLAEAANRLSEKNKTMNRQVQETERLYRVLQKSEREYKNVINSVSDILFELNEAGEILFLNQSWERVTEIDKRQVQSVPLIEFLDAAQHPALEEAMDEIRRGIRKKFEILTRLKTADQDWRTVELKINAADSKPGEEDGAKMVGTITDIEDQTRANRALSEAEKKYQTIVENAAGGIYQLGMDGRLVSANPALAHILGYETPNQLIDGLENMSAIYLDANDRNRYERELLDVGFIRGLETRIRRADGQVIWVSENARAVKDANGEIAYFEGSIEDITQRKNAEMALREAKIQSDLSSRAKSEFLANMSHELRTPLNAIIGFSEIIKSEAMGPLGQPAYSEYAGEIYGSGQQLLSIINEILDISRIEAGERALNEGLVKLDQVAQSCLNMMVGKLDSRKLQLNNTIDEGIPTIVGEELSFKQILLNLLSNAVKFTPDGGQITLGYDYSGPGADLTISITDTGIGIDEVDIPRVFSAFGQLDNALDRTLSGTGLGLTLAKALIEMHGGKIELVSQKGVGTTVTLIIPARRVSQGGKGEESRSNIRVLNPKKRS